MKKFHGLFSLNSFFAFFLGFLLAILAIAIFAHFYWGSEWEARDLRNLQASSIQGHHHFLGRKHLLIRGTDSINVTTPSSNPNTRRRRFDDPQIGETAEADTSIYYSSAQNGEICYETDGGADEYKKGKTIWGHQQAKQNYYLDQTVGEGIIEYYCEGEIIRARYVECVNGTGDGVCL